MKSSPARPSSATRTSPGEDRAEDHLGYLLKRLQHSIRQSIDEALRQHGVGLSFAHVATLFGIRYHPGNSGAQIAKRAMVTAQTMNTILRRLESEGSVERRPHPDNRRVDCWYITDAGLVQMQRAKAVADPVWDGMLSRFSETERGQLRGLLKRCIEGLERNRAECGEDADVDAAPTSRGPRRAASHPKKEPALKGK